MKQVGYLINAEEGLQGERGLYYDYIMASNGIFIEAEGEFLAARIPISVAEIRGLAPLSPKMVLRHGRIPQRFFDLAMGAFMVARSKEMYLAVVYDILSKQYGMVVPEQAESKEQLVDSGDQGHGCQTRVSYYTPENVVIDLHSHGDMLACFSSQDNKDEQGFKLYGVVGNLLRDEPVINLRIGLYGYFMQLCWTDVFAGCLVGARDFADFDFYEREDLYGI